MTARLFHYLSPKLLPVFPAETGTLGVVIDPAYILAVRSFRQLDCTVTMEFSLFAEGERLSRETVEVAVVGGKVQGGPLWRQFTAPALGYVEITFDSPEPFCVKIIPEPGYATLMTPDRGALTINADMKYANPRVIQQIKQYSTFCMLHSASLVDSKRGLGNSLLLINPYDQALVTRVVSSSRRKLSQRLAPRTACMVDLAPVLDDGKLDTIMVTASNRVITYDVRHAYGEPSRMNSLDHLDPFSGYTTHPARPPAVYMRAQARRLMRAVGLRPD